MEGGCLVGSGKTAALVGDRAGVGQVLVKLLANAVKFTEHGEVVLTVEPDVGRQRAAGVHVLHFTVRDTGIGISADRIDRLFESFSQGDASTTRRYGGTGLGLAISKRLCELMGGEVSVESEPGKGSAFHFAVVPEAAPSLREPPIAAALRGKR